MTGARMRSWSIWIGATLVALAGGCAEKASVGPADSLLGDAAFRAAHGALRTFPPVESKREHGKGQKRQTPVYIDGEYVGELRFRELPPSLDISWHPLDEGHFARRFAFADFLEAHGVPLAKVKALHLYGGRSRVMVIDGDELRRTGKAAQFQFTKGTGGNALYKHADPIQANTSIDKIRAVAVYVERDKPELKEGKLYLAGKRVEGFPYVDAERKGKGGTRVYLDGRFVGSVNRRAVDTKGGVALGGLLRSLDVNLASVRTAQLVVRDSIAAELAGTRLHDDKLALETPARSQGRFAVAGVAEGAPIDAVLLYAKAQLPDRDGPSPRTGLNDCREGCGNRHADNKDFGSATRSSVTGLTDNANDIGG
jgi:hypothetical protein